MLLIWLSLGLGPLLGDRNKVVHGATFPSSDFCCNWVVEYLRHFLVQCVSRIDGGLRALFLSPFRVPNSMVIFVNALCKERVDVTGFRVVQ